MNADVGLRVVAITHGVVGLATCACLIAFFAAGGPFGTINDWGNAVFGVLSLVLAWFLPPPSHRFLLLGVAAVGAILTVVGTKLVVSEITGYYLAGLWSSFGFALIGLWLVAVSRHRPTRLRRSGVVAGAVMLLGLVGVPGILMGLDDLGSAPVWTFVAEVSWAGTYLLFPAWSLRLAGRDRAERGG